MTTEEKTDKLRFDSERILNTGLFANLILALAKTIAGVIGHSRALLADGINSTSDVVYYFVVRLFFVASHKPADERHPFGHRQMESIASLVVGAFVITTASALFWYSVDEAFHLIFMNGERDIPNLFTLFIAIGTVLIKIYLYLFTLRKAKLHSNPALMALAYDHRNDILSASSASIGILFSWLGYYWFDPLAGAVVSLLILKTGIKIIKESSDELMDTVPGKILNDEIKKISYQIDGVKDVEEIKAHRFGPYLVANITIGIDGAISVAEGDRIATKLEDKLTSSIDELKRVYVHFHPEQKLNFEEAKSKR